MTLQQQLAEAKAAYHSLQTGTMARVVVDQNGERVEFVAANAQKLYSYIQLLESQCPCAPVSLANTYAPAGFIF